MGYWYVYPYRMIDWIYVTIDGYIIALNNPCIFRLLDPAHPSANR